MPDVQNNENKLEKLTPVIEYTYVTIYNLLNMLRSIKNYVQSYARDMRLQELEQYSTAIRAVEEAINGLTSSAKDLGAIYGLPEDMLHPEKLLKGLGEQIQRMQQKGELPDLSTLSRNVSGSNNSQDSLGTSTNSSMSAPSTPPTPSIPPTQPTQPVSDGTVHPQHSVAQSSNTQPSNVNTGNVNNVGTNAANATTASSSNVSSVNSNVNTTVADSQFKQNNQGVNNTSATSDLQSSNGNTAGKNDDDEIKKILDQLKALRNSNNQ